MEHRSDFIHRCTMWLQTPVIRQFWEMRMDGEGQNFIIFLSNESVSSQEHRLHTEQKMNIFELKAMTLMSPKLLRSGIVALFPTLKLWLLDVRAQVSNPRTWVAEAGECQVTNPVSKQVYVDICVHTCSETAIPSKVIGISEEVSRKEKWTCV